MIYGKGETMNDKQKYEQLNIEIEQLNEQKKILEFKMGNNGKRMLAFITKCSNEEEVDKLTTEFENARQSLMNKINGIDKLIKQKQNETQHILKHGSPLSKLDDLW